jgi:hypothetical protein
MKVSLWSLAALFVASGLFACGGSDGGSEQPDPDGGVDTGAEDTNDAAADTADPDVSDAEAEIGPDVPEEDVAPDMEPAPDFCESMGLYREAWQEADATYAFGDVAGDFTITNLDGTTWSFQENWSGCESYIFLPYIQDLRQNPGPGWTGDSVWATDIGVLMTEGPRNVHYFFLSLEPMGFSRSTRVAGMKSRFEEILAANVTDPLEQEHWRARFHFANDRLTDVPGSVGNYVSDYFEYMFSPEGIVDLGDRGMAQPPLPFAFAIGRDQKWDPVGSLSEVVGRPEIYAMTAYMGHFFNHRASVRAKVAQEAADTTVVELMNESVTERVFPKTVTLPDAAAMAEFDTFEIDIEIRCPYRNPFACSEWDRIAKIELCVDGEECAERLEIVRWITQYWRRGSRRWIIDASPFLGLLQEGGEATFRVVMGPGWERGTERESRMDLRFRTRGVPKSRHVQLAYRGGEFNAGYNDAHPPFAFEVPEGAVATELVVIVSGHGQAGGNNCAEWCDHRHSFSISGIPIADLQPGAVVGQLRGCAEQARLGVPPGQWGNWAPGRAYWCPGLPVPAQRFDMTTRVTPGASSQMFYRSSFAGDEPAGGSIDLSVYVVSYEE